MKKTNKKNSKMRKLLPAFAMLTVSAISLSSATYAWFTMNREVSVTGMSMRTKVSENLLIADDTIGSTAVKADNLFNNSLVQQVDGLIEPVSTVNGKSFFYTAGTNVQGNGAVLNKSWTAYDPSNTAAFAQQYALTGEDASNAKGYIDYVYQLKAINGSTESEIRLTGLDLTYGGTVDNGQKATRVAVFAENLGYKTGSAPSENLIASKGKVDDEAVVLKAIYTPSGAANFSYSEGTIKTETANTFDAVDSTTTRGDVVYNQAFSLPVGDSQTQYYKIIVRVWLEGEDTTCNNTTFMDLRDKWSVDMKWDFVATTDATKTKVTNIASAVSTGKITMTTSQTVADSPSYTISGKDYYALTSKELDSKQLYICVDAGAAKPSLATTSEVYTISTDGLYPTDVTNQVTITAAGG